MNKKKKKRKTDLVKKFDKMIYFFFCQIQWKDKEKKKHDFWCNNDFVIWCEKQKKI